jgi:hypothetical protein
MLLKYCDGEYHIEGELVTASKERLYMFFRNCLPVFNLLEGKIVFFLTPMPRYLNVNCCVRADHATNLLEDSFEEKLRKSLVDCRSFYKDFLFTSGLKHFNIVNPGLCVPREDEEGNQLWGPDPVHPRHEGFGRIIAYVCGRPPSFSTRSTARRGQAIPWDPRQNVKTWLSRDPDGWQMFHPISWSREAQTGAMALPEATASGEATTSCEAGVEVSLEASPVDSILLC